MKQLQLRHNGSAVARTDAGERGESADSTKYNLVYNARRYAPKRVFGLALNVLSGEAFNKKHFKDGDESLCFRMCEIG
jgi:hypothetical protein